MAPNTDEPLRLRNVGMVVVIVGGLVFVGVLALVHWGETSRLTHVRGVLSIVSRDATLWNFPRGHEAGVLTVIAVVTVGLAATGLLSDSVVTALPAACGSFYLLGQAFPWNIGFHYGLYRAGFWLATAAALTMAIGGVLAVVGAASFAKPSELAEAARRVG